MYVKLFLRDLNPGSYSFHPIRTLYTYLRCDRHAKDTWWSLVIIIKPL